MKKREAENSQKKKLPRGVSYDKGHRGTKKYKTRVFWNGKDRFVGRWVSVESRGREGAFVPHLPLQQVQLSPHIVAITAGLLP